VIALGSAVGHPVGIAESSQRRQRGFLRYMERNPTSVEGMRFYWSPEDAASLLGPAP